LDAATGAAESLWSARERMPEPFSRGKFKKRDKSKPFEVTSAKARIDAEAAKRKLEKVIHTLSGYALGLEEFDVQRALPVATPDDLAAWVKEITKAISAFSKLRSTLKGGNNE